MIISPQQIREARALLNLDQEELARRAQVSVITIKQLEASTPPPVTPATLDGVRNALEQAGVVFHPQGVRKRLTEAEKQARFALLLDISRRSAAELKNKDILTDDDLYDENGLPH